MKYPVYKPQIFPNTHKYVADCLESTWISSRGKYIERFEIEFSKYLNIDNSTSVSNGTTALHMCLCALGIKKDDEVIVPSLTYVASVNAIRYVGAKPVFSDSDSDTWNLNVGELDKLITKKTKAIMAVHLYGNPCDMGALRKLCDSHDLYLIEDVAEALGSSYENNFLGTFGDISSFSFFGNKTITTGEGGMVVSNNKELISKVRVLKNQGASDQKYWYEEVGYNYRMTNICAAIGLSQLENIDSILKRKRKIADLYKKLLEDCPLDMQVIQEKGKSSYWLISVLTENKEIRERLSSFLSNSDIETRPLFYPAHTMPMYASGIELPVADDLSARGLCLPSYPDLTDGDIEMITDCIKDFFNS